MKVKAIGKIAFDAVYEANAERVYRTALHYSDNNHYAAEEITQEVFLKLYMNMENINMKAINTWVIVTAKHMALNYYRDHGREMADEDIALKVEPTDSLEDDFFTKLKDKEYHELAETIFSRLYEENPRWHEALTITYLLEKLQKEVAEIMGVSLSVLHSMLYRAKQWIKKNYEEEFERLNDA